MEFAKFSSDFLMETFTLVDNLFINEYLPYLEEKQIKIYLYGLYLCTTPQQHNTVDTLCSVLDVTSDELISTYTFFEDAGLVQIISKEPLTVKYLSLKKAMQPPKKYKADRWTEFNTHLQSLFPDRIITPNEFNEYYSFIDATKIDDGAMLMIAQYCKNLKGDSVRYPYILTVARSWTTDGVKTIADVEQKLTEYDAQDEEMRQVLVALGRKGGADIEEKQTLLKWRRSWGFDLDAILLTAKSLKSSKNFKRLDSKLDEFFRMNVYTVEEIKDYNALRENLHELTININKTLGVFYESIDHEIEVYTKPWTSKGFSDEAILKTAHYCFVSGIRTLEGLNGVINKFYAQGNLTTDAINEFISASIKQENKLKEIIEKTGRSRYVTASDREYYRNWTLNWGFDDEIIGYAAECAVGKTYAMSYMNQLLSGWKNAGVKSVEDAKAKVAASTSTAQNFESRDYSSDEINAIFKNISDFDNIDL